MKMVCHAHANKTHFHKKGFALGLISKVRGFGTRKRPKLSSRSCDFAQSCTWNDVYKKASFQDRKIGNTPKFPSMEIYDIRRHCDDTFE